MSLSIRTKLFGLFIALVLIPFLIYTFFIMDQVSREAERVALYSANQILAQTGQYLDSRLDGLGRIMTFAVLDDTVRRMSDKAPEFYTDSLPDWIADSQTLREVMITATRTTSDISSMVLYMKRGLASVYEGDPFRKLSAIEKEPWFGTPAWNRKSMLWLRPSILPEYSRNGTFFGFRAVPDFQNLDELVGALRIDVPVQILVDILEQANFSAGSCAFLLDTDGHVVAMSPGMAHLPEQGAQLAKAARLAFAPDSAPQPSEGSQDDWKTFDLEHASWRVASYGLSNADWKLFVTVPSVDFNAFGERARWPMLIALALILPLLFPLAYFAAATSTNRIKRVIGGVRHIGEGDLNIQLPGGQTGANADEIGELIASFNHMVLRLRGLMVKEYEQGVEMKNLEMKALQAQINPHFLYNSLDLLNILALRAETPQISEAVGIMSSYYRQSLSGGAESVSIAAEVEHVRSYVRIQNLRFENAVEFKVDVPESLLGYQILKIVLQPLVENAIIHGIFEKPDERGSVLIKARSSDDPEGIIVVSVEDDGVGMDASRLEEVRNGLLVSKDGHGYGLRNIDRRLRVRYGPAFGLLYESAPHKGTKVIVRIPAVL